MSQCKALRSAWSGAVRLALYYVVFCLIYIWASGRLAEALAPDKATLARIEQWKGYLFILVTGTMLFFYTWNYLCRLEKQRAELLRQREILVAAERRGLAGLLASGIAHDMNNLLAGIFNSLDLREMDGPSGIREHGANLQRGVEALAELASRLQCMGRDMPEGEAVLFSPWEEARQALRLVRLHEGVRRCRLQLEGNASRTVWWGRPAMLQQALFNLVLNAAEAAGPEAQIRVSLQEKEGRLLVCVDDDGPGIPAADRPLILKTLHSGRGPDRGLGLLSVRFCAEMHGGSVRIEDSELGGARLIMELVDSGTSRAAGQESAGIAE